MAHDETIYMMDRITPKAGQAKAFLDLYMKRYAPNATARGLKHEFTWVAPAMWLDNQPNTLFIVWSVKGAPAWWAMEHGARRDPDIIEWWQEVDAMVESRHRSFMADVSDIASLTDV